MNSKYKCGFCGRDYQRKVYFSRHIAICELMCKSVKELRLENQELDDTPSLRALYDVVLEMASKMSSMEQKMKEMSKWIDSKKRKINIVDWLNLNYKSADMLSIENFIMNIKVEYRHLDYLFKQDYNSTILFVLQEILPLNHELNPIKAFTHKPNVLFAYMADGQVQETDSPSALQARGVGGVDGLRSGQGADGGNPRGWMIMSDEHFKQMINVIMKQLLDEFIIWQKANTSKMEQDDFAIKYANNVRKIMGGNLTREQIYSRVKLDLYKYLKQGVPYYN